MKGLPFWIALRYIRGLNGKLLSINARLSFIGVFTGVSLLVVVLSVFNGFQKQVKKSLFEFNPHITLSRGRQGNPVGIREWQSWKKQISGKLAEAASHVEGMISSPAIIRQSGAIETVMVRGQDMSYKDGKYKLPSHFPMLTQKAEKKSTNRPPIWMGHIMANHLGVSLGDKINVIVPRGQFELRVGARPSMKSFEVVGFFKTGHYQHDSAFLILPLRVTQDLFDIGNVAKSIVVRLSDYDSLQRARREVSQIWPYSIQTIEQKNSNFFAALKLEKTIMTTIVFLFILAGMVGIIVSTYNVVRSRKKDIGVLQALGMGRYGIVSIFTLNGFLMGALGTILGIMFGMFLSVNLQSILEFIEFGYNSLGAWYYREFTNKIWLRHSLIPRDVYYFDHLPVYIDVAFIQIMGTVSIFLAGMAAYIPAWRASKLEPIDVIRRSET